MNYKTKSCRHYESGKCKLSGLCNFAHGSEELNFYQKMARIDDKDLRTIETLSQSKVETSVQKIEKMETLLEDFYANQRQLLEQLKNFSLTIKLGCLKNDENITQMETTIISVYNSAVNYTQEIGRTMDIVKPVSKSQEVSPTIPHFRLPVVENPPKNPHFVELMDEWNEDQMETVKNQIGFILNSLRKLYAKDQTEFSASLSFAESAFKNNQMLEASKHLQKILYDKHLDSATFSLHKRIVEKAMSLHF